MARHFGYFIEQGPGGVMQEYDTATCGHCQKVMALPPARNGSMIVRVSSPCHGCDKFICGACAARGVCEPWEKQMERMETRARFLNAVGVEE